MCTVIVPVRIAANLLFRYTIPFVPVSTGDEHIIIIMTIIKSMRLQKRGDYNMYIYIYIYVFGPLLYNVWFKDPLH